MLLYIFADDLLIINIYLLILQPWTTKHCMKKVFMKPRQDAGKPGIFKWVDLLSKLVAILKGLVDIYKFILTLL